jgi:hypothetical protein
MLDNLRHHLRFRAERGNMHNIHNFPIVVAGRPAANWRAASGKFSPD